MRTNELKSNIVNLYKYSLPVKVIYVLEITLGAFLINLCIVFFKDGIYLDVWTFALPLLGIALISTGFTSSKVIEINFLNTRSVIEIKKESIFSTKTKEVPIDKMSSQIKTDDGKTLSLFPKLRFVLLDNENEIEEIKSDILRLNNKRLRILHKALKRIKANKEG